MQDRLLSLANETRCETLTKGVRMFGIGKLRKELRELRHEFENFKRDVVSCRSITVYKEVEPVKQAEIVIHPTNYHTHAMQQMGQIQYMSYGPPSVSIMHGEAIRKLAEHVGVEFKYQQGTSTPTCVVLQPKAGTATAKGKAK